MNVPKWLIPTLIGAFLGLSGFTFFYANGNSYLKDDPAACKNCHVMREQFDQWNRSSHKSVATCNDCHTPKNLIGKYAVKGLNGYNHGAAFTTGRFHEPIQIKPLNRKVALNNCKRCHKEVISRMLKNSKGERSDCISCHGSLGHPKH